MTKFPDSLTVGARAKVISRRFKYLKVRWSQPQSSAPAILFLAITLTALYSPPLHLCPETLPKWTIIVN